MSGIVSATKTCPKCGKEKTLSEYYKKRSGAYESYCKPCHRERTSTYEIKPVTVAGEAHEQKAIALLRKKGIYAVPGKASNLYANLDVLAWGCVRIEVKYGYHDAGGFCWRFTPKQVEQGIQGDIVILIAPFDSGDQYYLLPASNPIFYINGINQLKTGVKWQVGSTRTNTVVTDGMMALHRDNWQLIEQYRQNFVKKLKAGTYQENRKVEPERKQLRLIGF